MEVNCANPVAMTFAGHNVLISVHIPNLPCAIIGSCCHNLLSHVKRHTSNAFVVCRDSLVSRHPSWQCFVSLSEEWVWSCILRIRCVLACSFSKRALSHKLRFLHGLGIQLLSLLAMSCLNLLLHSVLIGFDSSTNIKGFFLQLVFLIF